MTPERYLAAAQVPDLQPGTLATLEDTLLPIAVIGYIDRLTRDLPLSDAFDRVDALPTALKSIYGAIVLDDQVRNGGFLQLFWNPIGVYGELGAGGLSRIGAVGCAGVAFDAIQIFLGLVQTDEWNALYGNGSLEAFSAAADRDLFTEVDAAYLSFDEDPHELAARYMRAHPDDVAHG